MKAKDFRIGNAVNTKDSPFVQYICSLNNKQFSTNLNLLKKRPFADLVPIKLTDDLLLRIGFNEVKADKNKWFKWGEVYEYKIFQLQKISNSFDVFSDIDNRINYVTTTRASISFLHELQNLYFCITKMELKLKLML
jgi:hypothetical protein